MKNKNLAFNTSVTYAHLVQWRAWDTRRKAHTVPIVWCLQVVVTLTNPRIIFLCKFVNNILYAIKMLTSALKVAPGSPRGVPEHGGNEPLQHFCARDHATASGGVPGPAPVVTVQILNLQVILPAGSAGSTGPVKRAIQQHAVAANLQSLQLILPGRAEAIQHVDDAIADIISSQLRVRITYALHNDLAVM